MGHMMIDHFGRMVFAMLLSLPFLVYHLDFGLTIGSAGADMRVVDFVSSELVRHAARSRQRHALKNSIAPIDSLIFSSR